MALHDQRRRAVHGSVALVNNSARIAARGCFSILRGDNYSYHMMEVIRSSVFDKWLSGLRDRQAMARIGAHLDRLALGHFGAAASVGAGVAELRIGYGPGYRV